MQNSAQAKKMEQQALLAQVSVDGALNAKENVVEFQARHQLIAQQAEEACNLEGNLGSADFEEFEQKYGFGVFA